MSDKETTICVYCMKAPAVLWTGHVKSKKGKRICAGWCEVCNTLVKSGKIPGFTGQWVKAMGKRKFSV